MTKTGTAYYVHLLRDTLRSVEINGVERPGQAVLLGSGEKLSFKYLDGKKLIIDLNGKNDPLDTVIKISHE
jgi:hypothetical protein